MSGCGAPADARTARTADFVWHFGMCGMETDDSEETGIPIILFLTNVLWSFSFYRRCPSIYSKPFDLFETFQRIKEEEDSASRFLSK